jgi:hypothetical protein
LSFNSSISKPARTSVSPIVTVPLALFAFAFNLATFENIAGTNSAPTKSSPSTSLEAFRSTNFTP